MTDAGLVLHKLQRLQEHVTVTRARRPAAADVLSQDLVLRDALSCPRTGSCRRSWPGS
jgi:hypothetical protein